MATTNDYVRDPKMSLIFVPFCNVGHFPFQDHLVKLLLLGDSAVGKFVASEFWRSQ